MKHRRHTPITKPDIVGPRSAFCALFVVLAVGCTHSHVPTMAGNDLEHFMAAATAIEYADAAPEVYEDEVVVIDPTAIPDGQHEYWDLPLQEALWSALESSKVMRDLGANVLRAPEAVETTYGPALQETDPRFGVEAALSDFDAIFKSSILAEQNDRKFNNRVFGNNGTFAQDLVASNTELSKRAATGSQFAIRHGITYDQNNSITNLFPNGSYDTVLEAEARQPLLQGAGTAFNRIAGPNSQPGLPNGVLIARTKTDISLADFEIRIRDFLSNVENAYWDLYFAYRDLDAKILARDKSLETLTDVQGQLSAGKKNQADLHQASEQYFRFQQEVLNALKGRPLDGTHTNNGSRAGTFRGLPGVRVAERRLRLLIGVPPSDHRLIRPADEPPLAEIVYDWEQLVSEAMSRRAELRRQQWQVKRRELELLASKNYLLPRLDLVGRYRWRGFGDDLLNPSGNSTTPFDNAYENLTSGDFQEWQVGVELSAPIGFRRGQTAVRNGELQLAREKAVLHEQQRQIVHEVSNAVAEVQRSLENYKLSHDRLWASDQQVRALKASFAADQTALDVVLDAQRRFAGALSGFHQSQVEYAVALKNVHFQKGTLLEYCGVHLAEGGWPEKAYHDAAERERWQTPPSTPPHVANPPIAAHPTSTAAASYSRPIALTESSLDESPTSSSPTNGGLKPETNSPPLTSVIPASHVAPAGHVVPTSHVVPASHADPANPLRKPQPADPQSMATTQLDPPPAPSFDTMPSSPRIVDRIGNIILEQTRERPPEDLEAPAPNPPVKPVTAPPSTHTEAWRKRLPPAEMLIR